MDLFVLKAIAGELDTQLRGATVERVQQPQGTMVVLEFNPPRRPSSRTSPKGLESLPRPSEKGCFRLLISVHPQLPRVHLTAKEFKGPKSPPAFCMLLRKYLVGTRIVNVTLRGVERIVRLNFERRDPVGRIERYTLVAEIMGRHSNLFLLDSRTGLILDALKMVPPSRSGRRPISRNAPYEPPPAQEKEDPLTIDEEAFLKLTKRSRGRGRGGKVSSKWLVDCFAGISPDVAAFLVEAAEKNGIWDAFRETRDRFLTGDFSPGVLTARNGDEGTVWVLPPPPGRRCVSFPSANAAADDLYGRSSKTRGLETERQTVRKEIQTLLRRKRRTVDHIRKDLDRSADAQGQQRKGEILLASLGSVPKGAESIRLRDLVADEEVDIPLDVKLTPQKNAERYFSRARKLRRMAASAAGRLKEVEGQVRKLEALEAEAASASDDRSLERIAAKLGEFASPKKADAPSKREASGGKGRDRGGRPSASRRGGRAAASENGKAARTKKAEAKGKGETVSAGSPDGRAAKGRERASGRRRTASGRGRRKGAASEAGAPASPEARPEGPSPAKEGDVTARRPQAASRRKRSSDYRSFRLEGGWEVLVGKHDRGNDRLLRRVAAADDVWMHAQGIPGSHVIVHHAERGKEVPPRVLEEAAKLAAFYSKGRESTKVPVDYASVKHLRRVRGGRPGQVTVSGQRTLLVPPELPEGLGESDATQASPAMEEAV